MTQDVDDSFETRLSTAALRVERLLALLLDDRPRSGEIARPAELMRAIRHGVHNGGTRLRPFLVV